jgi:hypothetical protein
VRRACLFLAGFEPFPERTRVTAGRLVNPYGPGRAGCRSRVTGELQTQLVLSPRSREKSVMDRCRTRLPLSGRMADKHLSDVEQARLRYAPGDGRERVVRLLSNGFVRFTENPG